MTDNKEFAGRSDSGAPEVLDRIGSAAKSLINACNAAAAAEAAHFLYIKRGEVDNDTIFLKSRQARDAANEAQEAQRRFIGLIRDQIIKQG